MNRPTILQVVMSAVGGAAGVLLVRAVVAPERARPAARPAAPVPGGRAVEELAVLAPKPGSSTAAARIRELAGNLERYWLDLSGLRGAMPPAALEIVVAQAGVETAYGGGWTDKTDGGGGDMRGSHNYGARQCGTMDSDGRSWRCVEHGDTRPPTPAEAAAGQTNNVPIPAKFRYYTSGEGRSAAENGAFYFLKDLTKTWPVVGELVDGEALAYAMRLGPKYRPSDRPGQSVFGRAYDGGLGYYGGFGPTMQERVGGYAKAIASRLPEVAAALGHDRVHATVPAAVLDASAYRLTTLAGSGIVYFGGASLVEAGLCSAFFHAA